MTGTAGGRHHKAAPTALSALLAAAMLVAGACSHDPAPQNNPSEATDKVAGLLILHPDEKDCVRRAFDADPALASVLNPQEPASSGRLESFVRAMNACVPPERLAESIAVIVVGGLGRAPAEQECSRKWVLGLSQDDRNTLLVVSLNDTALPGGQNLDAERVGSDLIKACKLADIPPLTGTTPQGQSPGAVSITRP